MKYYSVRDLRSNPKLIWEELTDSDHLVITNNGRPSALMLNIRDGEVEELLDSIQQAKAMRAINQMRMDSKALGNDELSLDEVDLEIKMSRSGNSL